MRQLNLALFVAFTASSYALSSPAHAEEVFSPYVVEHELEFEVQGIATTHDKNPDNDGGQEIEAAIAYSPTNWWKTEFEGEFEREAGPNAENLHYASFNWLNIIQLAEPGEFWIDPALFVEAGFAKKGEPDSVTFGVIGAKQIGPVLTTVNLFGHKEYGNDAGPIAGFEYSNQTKYLWKTWFQPGFEVFGDTDGKTDFQEQELSAGPGIFGKIFDFGGQGRALKYEVGYLFGATRATPDEQVRFKLEYEFFF